MSSQKHIHKVTKPHPDLSKELLWKKPLFWQTAIFGLAVLLYANTIKHGYALDDVISITMNSFTKKGFAGFKDILTKDSFVGFIGNASELSGGRWRPLALITFATERQFFGQAPTVSHIINVLLYGLCCVALFRLLYDFIIKQNLWLSLAATLLFTVHPIHTEVVANIKSRDEILSLLFILTSLHLALRYHYGQGKGYLLPISLICYFLALLSKENGVTGIAFIPLLYYVLSKDTPTQALRRAIPHIAIILFYMILRIAVIGFTHKQIDEVMNAPYMLATPLQALATKLYVLLLYIKLLFFPYPLSYDYSYHQIPYRNIFDFWTIVSVLINGALLVYAAINIRRKDMLSFALLFYFFSIFIVSNLLVDTGGVLGERFLFQPSVGYVLALVLVLQAGSTHFIKKEHERLRVILILTLIIMLPSIAWTYMRNKDWKNDNTLFITDVKTCPNSARTNNGAGTSYILLSDAEQDSTAKQRMLDTAILLLNRALKIHPTYVDPYLNLGVAYNRKGDIEKAEDMWNKARQRNPTHPKLAEYDNVLAITYLNKGNHAAAGNTRNYALAKSYYLRGLRYQGNNNDLLYNLGGLYFTIQQFDSARYYWMLNAQYHPQDKGTLQGLQALQAMGK